MSDGRRDFYGGKGWGGPLIVGDGEGNPVGQVGCEPGDFPELTEAENAVIRRARGKGWATYYPVLPDAATQARRTVLGARRFLASRGLD
jgi:hypothetical protein